MLLLAIFSLSIMISFGKIIRILAPKSSLFENGDASNNSKEPLCSSIIFFTIESPKPVPFSLFVTYGSNNLERSWVGKPIPLSSIMISRLLTFFLINILITYHH